MAVHVRRWATLVGITAGLVLGAAGSAFAGTVRGPALPVASQAVSGAAGPSQLRVTCDSDTSPTRCATAALRAGRRLL